MLPAFGFQCVKGIAPLENNPQKRFVRFIDILLFLY